MDAWLDERDVIDDDSARNKLEDAIVDRQRLDGDDPLAGDIDGDIGETEIEEEIAGDASDRQLAVEVLLATRG